MVEVVLGSFGRHFEWILGFRGPRTSDPEAWNGQDESKTIFIDFGVHFGVHVGSLEATFSEKSSTRVS